MRNNCRHLTIKIIEIDRKASKCREGLCSGIKKVRILSP